MEITEIFKALADNTRVRIVNLLSQRDILCSCDIETILEISQVNVSRHLAKLKNTKLINSEKKAQWVYYSINEEVFDKYTFIREVFDNNVYEDILINDKNKLQNHLKNKIKCGGKI